MAQGSELRTAPEVCKELDISRSAFTKWCKKLGYRKIGQGYVLTPAEVEKMRSLMFAEGKRLPASGYTNA